MTVDTGSATAAAIQVAARLHAQRDVLLADLGALVALDSPSGDSGALASTADWLQPYFAPLGHVTRMGDLGEHTLLVEIGDPPAIGAPLILCHYDTVWPVGTAVARPMAVRGDWVTGPGVLDMKGSIVLVRHVIAELRALQVPLRRGLRVLITPDEEIGNAASEGHVLYAGAGAGAALVVEPPLADGRLKTARKGFAILRCSVRGRAAHAGIEPEKGISAAAEAAHVLLAAHALARPEVGTTVNVGVVRAGTRANVVAEAAELDAEVRAGEPAEIERVWNALGTRPPALAGAQVDWSIVARRAPMSRVQATATLLSLAREIGAGLGRSVAEGSTGGVSEGNLTLAAGAPTLDGLGLVGVGAHSPEEAFRLDSIDPCGGLLAGLVAALSGAPTRFLDTLRAATELTPCE